MCVPSDNSDGGSSKDKTKEYYTKGLDDYHDIDMSSLSLREAQIVKLNERVEKITEQYIEKHIASGKSEKDLPIWIQHVRQRMTPVVAGAPVYQIRSAFIVYLYSAISASFIIYGMAHQSILESFLCLAFAFIAYDLYSGVLHVVFDHPANIGLPVLGQPCLEFQWHHMIPDDLVRKDFVDVCGDLNIAALVLMGINLFLLDLTNPVALVSGGLKIAMAYYGQFSHRSAHSVGPKLTSLGKFLQSAGLAISVKDHRSHHKEPYDEDFCLIGICNPLLETAIRFVPLHRANVWIAIFFFLTVFDIAGCVAMVQIIAEWIRAPAAGQV